MLRCPAYRGPVTGIAAGYQTADVRCAQCRLSFPFVDGVLRMLASPVTQDSAAKTFGFEWLARDKGLFETNKLYGLTAEQELAAFLNAYGIELSAVKGKTVLDAGCGDGTLIELIAGQGAEAVGIDINPSITVPARRCRGLKNVTVLQADVFQPCFEPASFDFVWCEGVIVHTANPRKAFEAVKDLVKPGGQMYVWVYPSERLSVYQRIRDLLVAPYRLPPYALVILSYLLAAGLFPLLRIGRRKRSLRTVAFDLFDNLSPRYQWRHTEAEVRRWFREAGFTDLRITGHIGMSGKRQV